MTNENSRVMVVSISYWLLLSTRLVHGKMEVISIIMLSRDR